MLADIRGRYQDFSERNGIIRQKVELQKVLGIWVGIDDTRNVHDKTNRLKWKWVSENNKLEKTHKLGDVI